MERLLEAQKALQRVNPCVIVDIVQADLTKLEDLSKLKEAVPRVDFLVPNAGIGLFNYYHRFTLDYVDKLVQLNVRHCADLTRFYLPQMLEKKYGRILLVSSTATREATFGAQLYAASKAFVTRFGRLLHYEMRLGGYKDIHVSVSHPGATWTRIWEVGTDIGEAEARKVFEIAGMTFLPAAQVALEAYIGVSLNLRETFSGSPVGLLIATFLPEFLWFKESQKMLKRVEKEFAQRNMVPIGSIPFEEVEGENEDGDKKTD